MNAETIHINNRVCVCTTHKSIAADSCVMALKHNIGVYMYVHILIPPLGLHRSRFHLCPASVDVFRNDGSPSLTSDTYQTSDLLLNRSPLCPPYTYAYSHTWKPSSVSLPPSKPKMQKHTRPNLDRNNSHNNNTTHNHS